MHDNYIVTKLALLKSQTSCLTIKNKMKLKIFFKKHILSIESIFFLNKSHCIQYVLIIVNIYYIQLNSNLYHLSNVKFRLLFVKLFEYVFK